MPVDRSKWAERLRHLQSWDCPTCGKGRYQLLNDTLQIKETGPSAAAHDLDEWEPEWIESRFAALMQCDYPACKEVAAVSGSSPSEFMEDYELQQQWVDHLFEPTSICPAPMPIQLPKSTPDDVVGALKQAAAVTWSSNEAAANKIRQAVEHLMTAQKVKKTTKTKQGKRIYLNLHNRIVEFQKTDKVNSEILLAIKWLGNSGSHSGTAGEPLTRSDLMDAYDMIEHVLENLYGTTKQAIMKKVSAINKKKGPVKHKKTSFKFYTSISKP